MRGIPDCAVTRGKLNGVKLCDMIYFGTGGAEMNKKDMKPKGLNPFLPFGTYVADGEPKVFGDRVYLYGSYDLFDGGYCSREYRSFSAPLSDLTCWTEHGVSFNVDDVPWSDAVLYAPDALCHNGRYYLFFCLSDGSEGVAESPRPEGPFKNARRITLDGKPIEGIDPSVLEDGGKIYYTWGQFNLKMGELSDDLCTLKPGTVRDKILTNGDGAQGFHEGSSLRKIGDKFCMIYASEYSPAYPNNGARPTKLDYAVGDSPYGPYERRGTVIDNDGCDPSTWNNHGSVIKINGGWYVFYHASSNNSEFSRRARAEKIEVDEENCVIKQAVPTSKGFAGRLLPEDIKSPVNACRFYGGAYVTEAPGGEFPAKGIKNGSGFSFYPVDFECGGYTLTLRCALHSETRLDVSIGGKTVVSEALPSASKASFGFTAPACGDELRFEFSGESGGELCEIFSLGIEKTV